MSPNNDRPKNKMANLYKKPPSWPPLINDKKAWDKKTTLPEVYKMQSNN
jgi:hypothetical protein